MLNNFDDQRRFGRETSVVTHKLNRSVTHPLTDPLRTHLALTHTLTQSPIRLLTHSLTHSPTHALTHSQRHALTHTSFSHLQLAFCDGMLAHVCTKASFSQFQLVVFEGQLARNPFSRDSR